MIAEFRYGDIIYQISFTWITILLGIFMELSCSQFFNLKCCWYYRRLLLLLSFLYSLSKV